MALKYPTYSQEEFNCISDLKGIALMIERVEKEQMVREIDAELQKLVYARPSTKQAIMRIEEEIAKTANKNDKVSGQLVDANGEPIALSELVRITQEAMQEGFHLPAIANRKIQSIAGCIIRSFSSFDPESFEAACKELVDKVGDSDSIEEKIKQLKDDRKKLVDMISKNWSMRVFLKFMKPVPNNWRDRRVSDDFKKGQMAVHIFKTLVLNWIERSKFFSVPVTVIGTAIHTLDSESRRKWLEMYQRLDLKPAESSVFSYFDAGRSDDKGKITEESLPGMFA